MLNSLLVLHVCSAPLEVLTTVMNYSDNKEKLKRKVLQFIQIFKCRDVCSYRTSEIIISSVSLSQTESKYMCIVSLCSDLTYSRFFTQIVAF